jgi:hypothetical protein
MQIEVIWVGVGIYLRQICLKLIFLCMHISFKAGLVTNKLTIALEPEAASIFCRHLSVHTAISGGNTSIAKMPVGTRYMILDAGGMVHLYYLSHDHVLAYDTSTSCFYKTDPRVIHILYSLYTYLW